MLRNKLIQEKYEVVIGEIVADETIVPTQPTHWRKAR